MRPPHLEPETDESSDEPAAPSRDAVTPRGGFMARPGLKTPPRHAVVVRGGDVEPSESIPVARGSQPPPAPASEPPPPSASDVVTLRAIPIPKSELPAPKDFAPPQPSPAGPVESLPPPSDM